MADAPSVRYFTTRDEFRRLETLDRRVFKNPRTWIRPEDAVGWARAYSRSVIALLRGDEVLGWARCLPLDPAAFAAAIAGRGGLRKYLVPRNVLTDDQAIARARSKGNVLNVGMVVYDPDKHGEHYGIAAPLFRHLLLSLHALRLRGLICQTETVAEETQVAAAGCRRLREVGATADGTRTVWDFRLEYAEDCPASGLGFVVHQIWAMRPSERVFPLTPTQLRVIDLTAQGYQDKEIATFLRLGATTVTTHWTNILRRVRDAHPEEAAQVTRAFVIARYRRPVDAP